MKYLLTLAVVLASGADARPDGKTPKRIPESLLPASTLAYVRYDGFEPHKKAYAKTALAKVMNDDLGKFLDYLAEYAREVILQQFVASGTEVGDLQKASASWSRFLDYYWRHGIVAGVDIPGNLSSDLRFQVTVVFPEGGVKRNREGVLSFLHLLADFAGAKIKESKLGRRTLFQYSNGSSGIAWWQEGNHVVATLGTEPVNRAVDVIDGRLADLSSTPRFKKLASFKRYETDVRGFIDVRKIIDLLRTPAATGNKLAAAGEALIRQLMLQRLGVNDLRDLTFFLGFDRQYQRSTIVLDVPEHGKRAGLLKLVSSGVRFEPAHLPALPPDAATVSVRQVDWQTAFPILRDLYREATTLARLVGFGDLPAFPDIDAFLGIDFQKDFLGSLDSTLVTYSSLSEGPFFIGQAVAIKVKDAKKLQAGLDALTRSLRRVLGNDESQSFQKKTYRGVDYHVFAGPSEVPIPLTYTVHKGWWVIGLFPQAVKGYILRTEGRHKIWQAPPEAEAVLAMARKEMKPKSSVAAVTVTDPKPAVAVGLSLMPVLAKFFDLTGVGPGFDVAQIPNAQAVNEWLFPSVTIFYDDGNALRWESHFSIEVPGEWILVVLYPILAGL
jgi:hypothetical protein